MKILLTCEDYFPSMGGAEVCVYNLRSELRRLGHEVTVFTNTMNTTDDEAGVVRVPWRFRPKNLLRHVKELSKLIKEHDITHCQYSFRIACICAILSRFLHKPMLLTQQGRGIVPEAGTKLRHAVFLKICQHLSMHGADLLTSTSDEITDLTAAFVPREKIVSISNGYDARLFVPDTSLPVPPEFVRMGQVKKLLTIRRLVPKNGVHILVQALALVKEQRQDFHYVAVGDGRSRSFIESLTEELQLQQHVTLLGERKNETLRAYYQHADLVLVPSSAEATSIACIEAMGMCKPLIASRVGGLIDLVGTNSDYGTLVRIYDSEACTYAPPDRLPRERLFSLANAILSFLEDPEPFQATAVKAMHRARTEFSWEAIAQRYLHCYDHIVSSSA